jgi:HK97 gp10 family phage protein
MVYLTVKTKGVNEVLKNFKKFGKASVKQFEDITKIKALEIAAEAKRLAPVDTGKLKQGILVDKVNKLTYDIVATEPYSAYLEFGTGTEVSIPKGWEDIAIQFKGKGVRKVNIPPQPYLNPAFRKGAKLYMKDLEKALERLTDRYE